MLQRLRLLLIRTFTRAAPAAQDWVSSLPRNTEEATAQFNYQLNLIGLQTEQWMTDNWARTCGSGGSGSPALQGRRQGNPAQKAPPGKGSGKGGGKGAGQGGFSGLGSSVGGWWDERVAATNQAWVSFQIKSARAARPGGKADGRGAARRQEKQEQKQQQKQLERAADAEQQPKPHAAKRKEGTHLFSWVSAGASARLPPRARRQKA